MSNNQFKIIEAAKSGRKKVHPILAVILSVVFLTFGELFMLFMLFLPKAETTFMKGIYDNVRMILTFGGTILIVFLWIRFIEKRSFSSIGFWKEQFLRKYVKGALIGFIFISVPVLLLVITGVVQLQMQHITPTVILGILGSLIAFLVQGATEEIVVRGWLFPVISVRSRIWIGVVVTSFLFGFLHLLNPGITVLSIANIILVGVFAAFYVLKENSLWGICAWHSIWNWAQYNVYGFAVSGTTVFSTPLFKSVTSGPDALHGGAFGIEGSVITTIMLASVSIILWRQVWERSEKQRNIG
ncbi:CPBP family intramembrane metalloprotease domain-containing protein [Bacillus pseudomycoides]|uniref:CPBP family intramembrane metalloprotease domain-containing protein n=1 Tax=Bacillus pseudomycoides TaxID=64104 RepID=A0AA91VAF7_9BACI|nr:MULTISPECIES: type II CAAX endopeptidase family protein [Bacillus]PEB51916.1 CPBP family intramembrane metalloprotease domain-containing protein [Bacillus sp. AFS098217]PED81523.1 CPBP family intramembrane metalloprotease domain-containing protein [Bacillus pseudomycoides]PEU07197.1 CPBP family intramembrane metalloprotease domain-containing protein [Bacillus sp. AFS019443]PEU08262.1 CPBP family intramembrane metalloprotease domain-containing protein [Bacillus sp. AFS014408]PFW59564.1 CPBP 